MAKEEKEERFDVDAALERIEEINNKLAEGELGLDESVALYREGVALSEKSRESLEGVEQKLQIINSADDKSGEI
ncbi:MAG TPA: exodeoxyribonuclease VII small subunit [Lachnospiraceae bacterium]|nr:exodeoxyribonuclease VII small subunit [Lachnospiraceae bacterium]